MTRKAKKQSTMIDDVFFPDVVLGEAQVGTPTAALFPARNYSFKVVKNKHIITVPRSGNYHKLAPEVFSEDDGDFMLYDDKNNVMYLPAISKILFATKKYPDLKSNQLFMPIVLIFNDKTVEIVGQVIEMLPPLTTTSTVV